MRKYLKNIGGDIIIISLIFIQKEVRSTQCLRHGEQALYGIDVREVKQERELEELFMHCMYTQTTEHKYSEGEKVICFQTSVRKFRCWQR